MSIQLASAEEQDPRRDQPITRCASGCDGDCDHPSYPQNRDNEPLRSGRSCPLWFDLEYT